MSEAANYDPMSRIVELSSGLMERAHVSGRKEERDRIPGLKEYICDWVESHGLSLIEMPEDAEHPFPYFIVTFPENFQDGKLNVDVALLGHVDLVPEQDEAQRNPVIDGDFLRGRGAADMETVSATFLQWMADRKKRHDKDGSIPPRFAAFLSFCEEIGPSSSYHSGHAFEFARNELSADIKFVICGERTSEMETESDRPGMVVCDENRGVQFYNVTGSATSLAELATAIGGVRSEISATNANKSSGRMKEDENWVSNMACAYGKATFATLREMDGKKVLRLTRKSADAMHSAKWSVDKQYPVEQAAAKIGALECDSEVLSIEWGVGKHNMASEGYTALVRVNESDLEVFMSVVDQEHEVLVCEDFSVDESDPGFLLKVDLRVLPEHGDKITQAVRGFCDTTNSKMLSVVTMSPFRTTPGCSYVSILADSITAVTGEAPQMKGKLHGNDGPLFHPDKESGNVVEVPVVVWGQTGIGPHSENEAHWIPSIMPYYKSLDEFADRVSA